MDIGVIQSLANGGDCFAQVRDFGLGCCQLVSWNPDLATPEIAATVRRCAQRDGVRVAAVWGGFPGPAQWNFTEGPTTLGLVPRQFRAERVAALKRWAGFAAAIGAPAVITHAGFIPENMTDPEYPGVVDAIREVAESCKANGVGFWFETGQETPVTLLRTIERVGTGNLGINLDPANLVMYGKGNPVDALDVIGRHVRNVHAKDGRYPTSGDHLGPEVAIGQGKVGFPALIARLKELGFTGELIIEREIHGEQQARDIRAAVDYLRALIA
ncbi:MAG: sugar phosphate isomerase/epimerase [Planctomycetes bacterium]|nr:sugar phosphate isomerase/epimerase [Planctomycetota bacterium]